jgi:site-specific DNA recombinase
MAARNSTSRDRQYHSYVCTRYSKGWKDCSSHTISNRALDQAAWQRVESLLLDPQTVERELTRLQDEDPTVADLETVERHLGNLDRQMTNLVAHLANLPAVAGDAVRRQIAALSQEHERLQTERNVILARRSVWTDAISRIGDVQTWCRRVSERLNTLSFEEKRQVIETLDVQATVYRAHIQPRFVITATIPLTDQMGQDSIFCVESQNIHS